MKLVKLKTLLCLVVVFVMILSASSCHEATEKLKAPTVGKNTANDVFWDAVENASGYLVYVNGIPQPIQNETTFPAVSNPGIYTIQVVALGDGVVYLDSDKSASIVYRIEEPTSLISALPANFDFFKKCDMEDTVYVCSVAEMTSDERLMMESIQGLCAKNGIGIYLIYPNETDYTFLFDQYDLHYVSMRQLIDMAFERNVISGYVKADSGSLLLAKTASSVYNAVIVTENTAVYLPQGVTARYDATTSSDSEWPAEIENAISKKVVVNSNNYTDLGIMNNARFSTDSSVIANYTQGVVIGEGDALCTVSFDVIHNLSVLSMLQSGCVRNRIIDEKIDANRHLVTLIGAESQLVEYINGNYEYPLFQSNLAMTLLSETNSREARALYLAKNVFANTNWDKLTFEQKNDFCALINISMGNAGMRYLTTTKDYMAALDKLCYMNNVQGGFVYSADEITWKNGKPFVGLAATLTNENAFDLAVRISSMSTDISSSASYTAIAIGEGVTKQTVRDFCAYLSNHVQVVRADTFLNALTSHTVQNNTKISIPSSGDDSYITDNHEFYNLFDFKYAEPSRVLYYMFTNSLSGFRASSCTDASIVGEDGCVSFRYENANGKNYLYNKILLPDWEDTYLNIQFKSSLGSSVKIILYSIDEDAFETLYTGRIKSIGYQDFSFDLNRLSFRSAGKPVVLIIEQNSQSGSREYLKMDNVCIAKKQARKPVFDAEAVKISETTQLPLTEDDIFAEGGVIFDSAIQLSTNQRTVYDDALSNICKKIHLSSASGSSYLLRFGLTSVTNALYRIRVVDQNYVNHLIIPWTYIDSDTQIECNLSSFAGQTIVVYVELSNKNFDSAKYCISEWSIVKKPGDFYYDIGSKDTFQGSSKVWNYDGWSVNNNCTYGDLTQESGYGSLRLDGSNGGFYDPSVSIACAWKNYRLPSSACKLSFYSRSGGPNDATYIRVSIVDEQGKVTVLKTTKSNEFGWVLVSGEAWVLYEYDLSAFAGQKITVMLEQTDHGSGIGEIAFIDNFIIEEKKNEK